MLFAERGNFQAIALSVRSTRSSCAERKTRSVNAIVGIMFPPNASMLRWSVFFFEYRPAEFPDQEAFGGTSTMVPIMIA